MSKLLNCLFLGLCLVSGFTFPGCGGGSGGVVETEVQTEQEIEDYDADMDSGDEIEK